jgi:hypothetical protein
LNSSFEALAMKIIAFDRGRSYSADPSRIGS